MAFCLSPCILSSGLGRFIKFYKYLNQDPKWLAETKARYYGYYGHS